MNDSNYTDPYRRNLDVIRKFFSKPIVLILAIAYTVSFIAYTVSGFLTLPSDYALSVNITMILAIAAFYLFYFISRRNKPYISYKAPIVFLKVNVIFTLVTSSIVIISMIVITMFYGLFFKDENITSGFISYFISAGVSLIIVIIHSIAMLVLLSSFKKSTTSIYLYKNGANLVGVTSVLLIIASAITELINRLFGITDSVLAAASYYDIFDTMQTYSPSNDYISTVNTLIGIVICLLIAVFAFSYSRYISKLSRTYNSSLLRPHTKAQKEKSKNFSDCRNLPNSVHQAVEFDPMPVFTESPERGFEPKVNAIPEKPLSAEDNPYLKKRNNNVKYTDPRSISCPNCGNLCPDCTSFCGNCGARLK